MAGREAEPARRVIVSDGYRGRMTQSSAPAGKSAARGDGSGAGKRSAAGAVKGAGASGDKPGGSGASRGPEKSGRASDARSAVGGWLEGPRTEPAQDEWAYRGQRLGLPESGPGSLATQGRRLGVVTAKRRSTVELAFARIPIGHVFETVVGGDETEKHKPDPEPLLEAARRMQVAPSDCAYVGDSPFDIRAAKAAGMYAIAVTWGRIHDRSVLEQEAPDAIVDTAEELVERL